MNHLMIVESPTKKGTLEKILGPDWTVVATSGHVQDLPVGSGLGFDKNSLEIYYELSQRGKKIINGLKRHIDYFSRVVVATDSDREGEAIAQHVVDLLDIQNRYERCTFNSITKKTVQAAMSGEMREIDTNLVAAQESRRMLDRFADGSLVTPSLCILANVVLWGGCSRKLLRLLLIDKKRLIISSKLIIGVSMS